MLPPKSAPGNTTFGGSSLRLLQYERSLDEVVNIFAEGAWEDIDTFEACSVSSTIAPDDEESRRNPISAIRKVFRRSCSLIKRFRFSWSWTEPSEPTKANATQDWTTCCGVKAQKAPFADY